MARFSYSDPLFSRNPWEPNIHSYSMRLSSIVSFRVVVSIGTLLFLSREKSNILLNLSTSQEFIKTLNYSWHSKCSLVWCWGWLQRNGHWLTWTQLGRPLQLLQAQVLPQDCAHACRSNGKPSSLCSLPSDSLKMILISNLILIASKNRICPLTSFPAQRH